MTELVNKDFPIVKEVWSQEKAVQTFSKMKERFKVEIIQDLKSPEVSIYHQGDWFDLCRGFRLTSLKEALLFLYSLSSSN